MLTDILLATLFVSLLSLVGIFFVWMQEERLEKTVEFMVCFAVGGLLGGAFLHLLPEAVEEGTPGIFTYALAGILVFFLIEKLLHWRHCHRGECDAHTFTWLSLAGDGVHNFIDGMIIAAAFMADARLGLATTVAVAAHEIPQEISDFGILVYGGFSRLKALLFNLLTALTAVAGAVLTYFALDRMLWLKDCLIPLTAGGFIYVALADMLPELHKRTRRETILWQFLTILAGVALMWGLKAGFEH